MEAETAQQWTPSPWFLVTPPAPKPNTVSRPRITDLLTTTVNEHIVTLVEAPSGFGKSTALATWVRQHPDAVGWLTLTRHDADPFQLLTGVMTALLTIAPEDPALRALAHGTRSDENRVAAFTEGIVDAVFRRDRPTVLIIDDAHLSSQVAVHEVLVFLAAHSRNKLRFVLSGTGSMSDWFASMLLNGEACTVTARDLAFDAEEIRTVLGQELPEDSEPGSMAHVAQVFESTNGWPVAVQLMLRTGMHELPAPGAFVGETSRALTAYIETEVLGRLRSELHDFVMAAATCDRVSADLAARLTGAANSSILLEECVQAGLFLDSFQQGDSATVYQWHSVFAQHCRILQHRKDPDTLRARHRAAAEWLATGYPAEAVAHALHAADGELATTIIHEQWLRMIIGGQATLLASCCLQLPEPFNNTPEMLYIRACCRDVSGDRRAAAQLLARADAMGQDSSLTHDVSAESVRVFAQLFLADDQETLQNAADHVRSVLLSPTLGTATLIHGSFLLGWTELRLRRDPARAAALLSTVAHDARAAGLEVLADRASMNLAFALAFAGRLTAASSIRDTTSQRRATVAEGWKYYDGGIETMTAVFVDYWRNDLGSAVRHCQAMQESGGHSASYAALSRVYFGLTAAALHDPALMNNAELQLALVSDTEVHGVPWQAYKRIASASISLARGDVGKARADTAPLQEITTIPVTMALLAEMYRRTDEPRLAMQMLRKIQKPEMVSYVNASALVTSAAIAWDAGDHDRGHQYLERALNAAVPERIVRPFADLDDVLRDLFASHAGRGSSHEGFLATRLGSGNNGINRHDLLALPLSVREQEIFGYLHTTLTADEIAAQLHVSVNTIRTHQRAIYRKLGVNSRRAAVRSQF